MCAACAQATAHTAVVPDTACTVGRIRRGSGSARSAAVGDWVRERMVARNTLEYLAACLPPELDAKARLLALQCALRADAAGCVVISSGLLRAMRLAGDPGPWQDLEDAWWVHPGSADRANPVRLMDGAGTSHPRAVRARAADWALRVGGVNAFKCLGPHSVLTGLVLAAYGVNGVGLGSAERLAHLCGLRSAGQLHAELDALMGAGFLMSWTLGPDGRAVVWRLHPTVDAGSRP